jgi:hypothetical protein
MKSKFYVLSTIALFSALLSVRGEMSGESGRSSRFVGKLDPAASFTNQCEFSVEIERVMFKLNSLKDKYKLVRIRVENRMSGPIKLSGAEDGIELEMGDGNVVRGTFNLQGQDGSLWDSLSEDMRKALAYPLSIRGVKGDGVNPRRPEVVYVFAFFPADKASEVPRSFRYTIQSVGKTVKIELPPATGA